MKKNKNSYNPSWVSESRGDYHINRAGLYRFLEEHGFRRYNLDPSSRTENWVLVQLQGNVVSRITGKYLAAYCSCVIAGIKNPKIRESVSNSFLKNSGMFTDQNVSMLPMLEDRFVSDTRDRTCLFFHNVVVIVFADRIETCTYDQLDGYVWQNHIIDFDLTFLLHGEGRKSEMEQFCEDITTVGSVPDPDRFRSLESIIGYLLHRYKDPTTTRAIILMDSRISDNPSGGSGKGILIYALAQIRTLAREDGKSFSPRRLFAFSQIDFDTSVLVIDDVQRDFNFELLFVCITDGFTVERKYKDKVYIPATRSPKVMLTTNYVIVGVGYSHERRKVEFELSDFYGPDKTPLERFGHRLFDEWDQEEWNRFFLFMIRCAQIFLSRGLIEPVPLNKQARKLMQEIPESLLDYIEGSIEPGVQYDKKMAFLAYQRQSGNATLTLRRFIRLLKTYAEIVGLAFGESHSDERLYFTMKRSDGPTSD